MPMSIERLGETAVVLRVDDTDAMTVQRRIWHVAAQARAWTGVDDAVAGMNNLTLFVDAPARAAQIAAHLRDAWGSAVPAAPVSKLIEVPVQYGGAHGPDLSDVARRCNVSDEALIALHAERVYDAYFLGFQPGFAYLGDLDARLRVPRREQPRTSTPAGSVAIAEGMTAIYPSNAPGGWHVIGKTTLQLFDRERDPPSLLLPGDRVRFVPVGAQ